MPGLLINGREVGVPGCETVNQYDADWCALDRGDCRPRRERWVRQIVIHTTKGEWPQSFRHGKGPGGRCKRVADYWRRDDEHSGAHLVVGSDGAIACLADLGTIEAYHATVSNRFSVGIEIYQERAGEIYEAAMVATVALVRTLCLEFGIQYQLPRLPYRNGPKKRLEGGGSDWCGIMGHRDNTSRRGRGDPGDAIFERLIADGAESFDLDTCEDLAAWKRRQEWLCQRGHMIAVDGVPGPATRKALMREGSATGIWAFDKR